MKLFKYNQFINESKVDIDQICKMYDITNYTINPDGSIDVDGNVDLSSKKLTKIPLKFNHVSGYFSCSSNQLTSLEGGPNSVGGDFDCYYNQLTNLEGCPNSVGGYFYCSSNQLKNVNGFPEFWEGNVYISNNPVSKIFELVPENKWDKLIYWLNEHEVIQGDQIIYTRLEEVFNELGLEIPEDLKIKGYELY